MSGTSLIARPLALGDLDAWERLAGSHGCIFDTLQWTELFRPALTRVGIYDASDNLRGGFSISKERRFGLWAFRNPPYTPQAGPFYEFRATNPAARTDEQRAVVEAMAAYLSTTGTAVTSLGLSPGITDTLPFFWRGWKVVPHYTYRIDLAQDEGALLGALSTKRRNDIRKAGADGVYVQEVEKIDSLRSLMGRTYARQRMASPATVTELVFSAFPPGRDSYCLIAKRGDGRPEAGAFVIHDARTAYYLIGGYSDKAHHGAGALAMWHAIRKAKAMGLKTFDFEGSVVPPIERYFRGFGGVLTPIFTVNKAWLPVEVLLKLHPHYRNRF